MRRVNAQRSEQDLRRAYEIFTQMAGKVIDFDRLTDRQTMISSRRIRVSSKAVDEPMFENGPIDMAMVGGAAAAQVGADEILQL